jgi:hypothetical protein
MAMKRNAIKGKRRKIKLELDKKGEKKVRREESKSHKRMKNSIALLYSPLPRLGNGCNIMH